MTTSVYTPIDLNGLSRNAARKFCHPGIQKAKRSLFAVDHEGTQKFLHEQLQRISVNDSTRWNFDFVNERTLSPNGDFIWQMVNPHRNQPQPIKRPASPISLTDDLYATPDEIIRPKPLRPNCSYEDRNANKIITRDPHQKKITDFMKAKKRQILSEEKKHSSALERPSKIPKLADSS